MNELSERAQELRRLLGTKFSAMLPAIINRELPKQGQLETEMHALIEQALLAERRLAMEEAAKIADVEAATCCEDNQWKMPGSCSMGAIHNTANRIAKSVRAAAEKEVGK